MVRSSSRLRSNSTGSTGSSAAAVSSMTTPKTKTKAKAKAAKEAGSAGTTSSTPTSSSSTKKRGRSRTPTTKKQADQDQDQEQQQQEESSSSSLKIAIAIATTPSKTKTPTKNKTTTPAAAGGGGGGGGTKSNTPAIKSNTKATAKRSSLSPKKKKTTPLKTTTTPTKKVEKRSKKKPIIVAVSSSPLKEKPIKRNKLTPADKAAAAAAKAVAAKEKMAASTTTPSSSSDQKKKKKKKKRSTSKNQQKVNPVVAVAAAAAAAAAAPSPVAVPVPVPVPVAPMVVTIFPPNRRESTKSTTTNIRKTKVGDKWVAAKVVVASTPSPSSSSSKSKKNKNMGRNNESHDDDEMVDLPTPPPTIESSTTKMKRKRKRRSSSNKSLAPVSEDGVGVGVGAPAPTSSLKSKSNLFVSPSKNNNNKKIVAITTKDNNNKKKSKKSSTAAVVPSKSKKGTTTPTKKTLLFKKNFDNSSDNNEKDNSNNKFPPTLDARVHRIRHMGYIPGSISAMTSSSGEHNVAVARTDGSYELKSIIDSSTSTSSGSVNNNNSPQHRLITIAETPPITGTKSSSSLNTDDEEDGSDDDDNNNGQQPQQCYDAATSLCWVHPSTSSSSSSSSSSSAAPAVCVGSGPNGNLWTVNFHKSNPIQSIVSSGGGGIFDLTTCDDGSSSSSSSGTDGSSSSLPLVAAACEDGSVRVWRVGESEIQDPPLVTLPSAGAPVLSLVWKLVHVQSSSAAKSNKSCYKTVIFAAIADGTIRKYGLEIEQTNIDDNDIYYSVPNLPKSILRMTIENKGRREPTKVWTLCLLNDDNDNTLVSGNSLGQIQFWNSDTGTLTQTVIQSSNQADVLKIVANKDETKLFASGVDSKIVCLERKKIINASANANAATTDPDDLTALVTSHLTSYRPWKMTISQRPHTHDVKAMSVVSTNDEETLLTGGIDTKICSYSVMVFATTQPQSWYPWPCTKSLISSTTKVLGKTRPKLLSMQRYDSIELYQLSTLKDYKRKRNGIQSLSAEESHRATLAQHPTSIPVGTIRLGGDKDDDDDDDDDMMISSLTSTRMQSSLLSPDGKFLAVSNATSTYVFHLKHAGENDDGSVRLEPMKLVLPSVVQNVSATVFHFVGDDLYVGNSDNRKVHIVRLKTDTNANKKGKNRMDIDDDDDTSSSTMSMHSVSLPESQQNSNNNNCEIELPIQSIHSSEDGKFMVTMSRTQDNAINIFYRKSNKALYEHYWTLPSLGSANDSRPAAIAIVDGNKLAVATYQSHLYLFDIESKSLNEWSEQNGFPIKDNKWTDNSLCGRGYPLRLIPLQQQKDRIIMVRSISKLMTDALTNERTKKTHHVIPHYLSYLLFWGLSMLQHYNLITFRPFQKHLSARNGIVGGHILYL
jgi:hypothetical protein